MTEGRDVRSALLVKLFDQFPARIKHKTRRCGRSQIVADGRCGETFGRGKACSFKMKAKVICRVKVSK